MEVTWVTGHGGVKLAVRTAGDPTHPALVLIHGWSQHSLAFRGQLKDLADRFFVVAPDLRGHGASDKPMEDAAYATSAPWAGDVAAVIDQLSLSRPLLAGWSMGGWVVNDYIRVQGTGAISGISLIGSSITTGRETPHGCAEDRHEDVRATGMLSEDDDANIQATVKFLRACTAEPLAPGVFAEMVGLNMLVPPHVRAACRDRHEDYRELYRAIDVPVQVLWGDQERLAVPPYIDEMLDVIPNAEACCLEGLGHAPFLEDSDRFNAALGDFAARCQQPEAIAI